MGCLNSKLLRTRKVEIESGIKIRIPVIEFQVRVWQNILTKTHLFVNHVISGTICKPGMDLNLSFKVWELNTISLEILLYILRFGYIIGIFSFPVLYFVNKFRKSKL